MARFIAPEGATGVSWNGQSFEVADGILEAPEEAAADLKAHGFRTEGEPAVEAAPVSHTLDDLEAARAEGYAEGKAEAEANAAKIAAEVAEASAKTLAEEIEKAKAEGKAEAVAEAQAEAAKAAKTEKPGK